MIKQPTVFSVKIIPKLEEEKRRMLVDIDHQAGVTQRPFNRNDELR